MDDLYYTRLSRRPFSRPLLAPSRQPVVSLSQSSCVSSDELTDGRPNHTTARKSGPSFNTLCLQPEEIVERWLDSFKISRSPSENYTCHRICQWRRRPLSEVYIFSLHHSTELCTGVLYKTIHDQSHASDIKSDLPKFGNRLYLRICNFIKLWDLFT